MTKSRPPLRLSPITKNGNAANMKTLSTLSAIAAALILTACASQAADDNQTEAAKRKVAKVLFIGDSITDGGWGNSCGDMRPTADRNQTDMNHIFGHSYMMLCASQIQSQYPERDIKCYNRGISGNTVYDLAARWDADAVALDADVVSILVGTNDIEYYVGKEEGQPPFGIEKWDAAYRGMLDTLRCVKSDVALVLCTPFVGKVGWRGDAPNFGLRQSLIDSLDNRVVKMAAEYGATLVRFDELFAQLLRNQPRPDYWIWDGVHPTPAGHRRMADLWLEKAGPLFQ